MISLFTHFMVLSNDIERKNNGHVDMDPVIYTKTKWCPLWPHFCTPGSLACLILPANYSGGFYHWAKYRRCVCDLIGIFLHVILLCTPKKVIFGCNIWWTITFQYPKYMLMVIWFRVLSKCSTLSYHLRNGNLNICVMLFIAWYDIHKHHMKYQQDTLACPESDASKIIPPYDPTFPSIVSFSLIFPHSYFMTYDLSFPYWDSQQNMRFESTVYTINVDPQIGFLNPFVENTSQCRLMMPSRSYLSCSGNPFQSRLEWMHYLSSVRNRVISQVSRGWSGSIFQ